MLHRYTILDLECVPAHDAEKWMGEIKAPGNYSKADSIASYLIEEKAKRLARAALDPDLTQIVAFGLHKHHLDHPEVHIATEESMERSTLEYVWGCVNATTPLVGYGLTWYDAGILVRRSQVLGVPVPAGIYEQGKYRHPWIVELADRITLNGMIELDKDQRKGRGLDYYCRRFGIHIEDDYTGKDIKTLWDAGNIEGVRSHCVADLSRTRQLAEKLGVIRPREDGPVTAWVAADMEAF